MRRHWIVFALLALGAAACVGVAVAAARAAPGSKIPDRVRHDRGGGHRALYFAIGCDFSHRNTDDAIIFPRQPGRSHDHTYFGNEATNAFSTPDSLRGGATSCGLRADTAAYWAPTLFVNGRAVEPRGAIAYYIRRTLEPVQAFPAGLKVIAGDAGARSAQNQRVTFWTCGAYSGIKASTVPTCASAQRGRSLRLQVNFPNCWDGRRLDSADHKSHMAYSTDGVCPGSHPVEVPALTLLIGYPVTGSPGAELSSGGQFSGHADFVNAWDQRVLEALVDRYLNRRR